ncbi:MAG: hypothetical protein KF691_00345 [Phycisphaeraceae bacterium]|nr:hypothetical protein [Phycisphaeraceae bacterium]
MAMANLSSSILFDIGMITSLLATMAGVILFPVGWWLLSAPDPGVPSDATGHRVRSLIRITVFVAALSAMAITMQQVAFPNWWAAPQSPLANHSGLIRSFLQFASVAAWIVQFFTAMIYIRWLAMLIPSPRIYKRARLLMWLGPLLCLFYWAVIPALIAAILYSNLFSWVKEALTEIAKQQKPIQVPAE